MLPLHASFMALDALRRSRGALADAIGAGPRETRWREAARWPGARLRAYGGGDGPPLLIIAAPFKRPYLWDLLPQVSPVRAALARGFRVFLLEWLSEGAEPRFGLADYALRLPEAALAAIAAETKAGSGGRAVLAGHSLGGTFAALLAARRPHLVSRLALVDAPIAFGPADGGPLAEAIAGAPPAREVTAHFGGLVPGSAINQFSARAAPAAFVRQPAQDAVACAGRPDRLAVHLRVVRWTLDEFPMPARLFEEIAEDLYRADRFRAGTLRLGGETARLAELAVPVAAIVNPAGLIVPPRSILAGLRLLDTPRLVLRYRPEPGPALQHLGPLVGQGAHRDLWPRLLDWLARPAAPVEPKPRRKRVSRRTSSKSTT